MPLSVLTAVSCNDGAPLSIESVNIEEPPKNEVLVEIVATGIYHADINIRNSSARVPKLIILGHEGAGWCVKSEPQ